MNKDKLSIFSESKWSQKFKETHESYQALASVTKTERQEAVFKKYSAERVARANKLGGAYKILSAQILVVFCTYIEVMIKDFMYTVFQDNPDIIQRKFFPNNKNLEYDKFNSNENRTYEDICAFSILAAENMFNFKVAKVINKICDISEKGEERRCKERLSKLKSNLMLVFQIRNFIIHENSIKYIKDKNLPPVVIPVYKLEPFIETIYTKLAPSFINELNIFCKNLKIEKHQEIIKKEEEEVEQLLEILGSFGL